MVLRLISIHALREEGDHITSTVKYTAAQISIHALREEGDYKYALYSPVVTISIHALREEGDNSISNSSLCSLYFYPRPPRGGRQQKQRQNLYFLINYTTFCTNLEEL